MINTPKYHIRKAIKHYKEKHEDTIHGEKNQSINIVHNYEQLSSALNQEE